LHEGFGLNLMDDGSVERGKFGLLPTCITRQRFAQTVLFVRPDKQSLLQTFKAMIQQQHG